MEEKMMNVLVNDIRDLKEKLIYEVTRYIKNPQIATGEDGQKTNMSELRRKKEVRNLRSLLKDKITSYELIKKAREIEIQSEM